MATTNVNFEPNQRSFKKMD